MLVDVVQVPLLLIEYVIEYKTIIIVVFSDSEQIFHSCVNKLNVLKINIQGTKMTE